VGEWRPYREAGIETSFYGLLHVEVGDIPRKPDKNRLLPLRRRHSPLANRQNFHMEGLPLHAR
jgi:hypothetical protein